MKENEAGIPAAESAKEMIARRAELLSALLDPKTDLVVRNKHAYKKKSYWRKLAIAASVSIRKIEEWKETDRGGTLTYFFTVRASLPSGQFTDGTGACSRNEQNFHGRPSVRSIHETRATAETRAKNRAISDLLAFGEVSAEEISVFAEPEAENAGTDAPEEPGESDKQSSLRAIRLLAGVLPGDAGRLLEAGVHEKKPFREVESIVRKLAAGELEAIRSQDLMSLAEIKTLSRELFPEALSPGKLTLEQFVKLLEEVHKRVDTAAAR